MLFFVHDEQPPSYGYYLLTTNRQVSENVQPTYGLRLEFLTGIREVTDTVRANAPLISKQAISIIFLNEVDDVNVGRDEKLVGMQLLILRSVLKVGCQIAKRKHKCNPVIS